MTGTALPHQAAQPSEPDVLVVGSFVVGIVVRTDHLPRRGETLIGDSYHMGPGGKGTNAAIAAARSGANVSLVCRVGDDDYATMAEETLRREGIAVHSVRRTPGVSTAVGLVHLDREHENCIAVYPGANDSLSPRDVDQAVARLGTAPRVVVCQHEVPADTVSHTVRWANSVGAAVVLNPAPFRSIPSEILRQVDVLTPNEGEAHDLYAHAGLDTDDVARRLQRQSGKWVVITTGRSGCTVAGPEGYFEHMPAHRVKAVDTTGAGDTFTGALAAAMATGADIPTACAWALAAAALSTTGVGSVDAIPREDEIRALLEQGLKRPATN